MKIEIRNIENTAYFILLVLIWLICFLTTISWITAYIAWDFRGMNGTIRASIFYFIFFFLLFKIEITKWK